MQGLAVQEQGSNRPEGALVALRLDPGPGIAPLRKSRQVSCEKDSPSLHLINKKFASPHLYRSAFTRIKVERTGAEDGSVVIIRIYIIN